MTWGGFPEIALYSRTETAYDILNAYSKTILYQDVAARLGLKKPLDLERMLYYLMSHTGVPFTYAGLNQVLNLTDKTIKEHLSALTDAFLLFEVDKFSYSVKKQLRAPKKVYAIDVGMVNAIGMKFSENHGRLFENTVFLELKRRRCDVYYYRTKQDYEVDFIVKKGPHLLLIEVCLDLTAEKTLIREQRGLVQACQELGISQGLIVTADDTREDLIEGITIRSIPLYQFLLNN